MKNNYDDSQLNKGFSSHLETNIIKSKENLGNIKPIHICLKAKRGEF